jgi:metal transporter CNNM
MLSLAKLVIIAISQIPFAASAPVFSTLFAETEPPKEPSDPSLWLYLGFSAALVLSGGAFAGLTIALMGQVSISRSFRNSPMNQPDSLLFLHAG